MTTMSVQPSAAYYLAMPDAVNVNLLPAGFPAYLGYSDSRFRTAPALQALFPEAQIVLLTVKGSPAAHGIRVKPGDDVEPGDMTAESAAAWVRSELQRSPLVRPVAYASVIGEPGYGMADVMKALTAERVALSQVRLLSAHYGLGPHICGPATCKAISSPMDGTQWTDQYTVPGGFVDMSILHADFFSGDGTLPAPAPITETERLVRELGIVRQGDTGPAVRTVQGLCNARQSHMLAIDGVFGPATLAMVRSLQGGAKIPADGVVGPLTWPMLLGVA